MTYTLSQQIEYLRAEAARPGAPESVARGLSSMADSLHECRCNFQSTLGDAKKVNALVTVRIGQARALLTAVRCAQIRLPEHPALAACLADCQIICRAFERVARKIAPIEGEVSGMIATASDCSLALTVRVNQLLELVETCQEEINLATAAFERAQSHLGGRA